MTHSSLRVFVVLSLLFLGQGCPTSTDLHRYRDSLEIKTDHQNTEKRVELDPGEVSFTYQAGMTHCSQNIGRVDVKFFNFDRPARNLLWTAEADRNSPWLDVGTTSGFGEYVDLSFNCRIPKTDQRQLNGSMIVRVYDPKDDTRIVASSTLSVVGRMQE